MPTFREEPQIGVSPNAFCKSEVADEGEQHSNTTVGLLKTWGGLILRHAPTYRSAVLPLEGLFDVPQATAHSEHC